MNLLKIKGVYNSPGTIVFKSTNKIEWNNLTDDNPPDLPPGSIIELTISFDEKDFLSGKSNIVWATYDLRQAEIIQSALLAQQISSEIKNAKILYREFFLIKILSESDIDEAINFIWKSSSGLRLKPDWLYAEGEINKSFEQWLGGH